MRGAGGRGGRVALACKTLRGYAGVCAGVCMQDFVRHPTRRWGAADDGKRASSAIEVAVMSARTLGVFQGGAAGKAGDSLG